VPPLRGSSVFCTDPHPSRLACARLQGGLDSFAPAALGSRAAILIFPDGHHYSSSQLTSLFFPMGIIIIVPFDIVIFPNGHPHSSFLIGIIIHLSN
jgi:hypothetical protein